VNRSRDQVNYKKRESRDQVNYEKRDKHWVTKGHVTNEEW
jgi:hypothetical protein